MQKRKLTAFGVEVKKKLVEIGMTQKDLAKLIGMGEVYLNVILHGKRSGEKYIPAIKRTLNII